MNEKQKILKMVEDGKINAQEALDLLEALGGGDEAVNSEKTRTAIPGRKKMFRVRIEANDKGREKARVNINIPIDVAKKLTSLTKVIPDSAKKQMEKEGFNIDELNLSELLDAIGNGDMEESIVDIDAIDEDGNSGAKVKIYVD